MSFPSQRRLLLSLLLLLLAARASPAQTQQEEEQQQQQQQQGDKQLGLLGSDQVSRESQQVSAVVSADLDAAATGQIILFAALLMLIMILIVIMWMIVMKIIMMKVIPLCLLSLLIILFVLQDFTDLWGGHLFLSSCQPSSPSGYGGGKSSKASQGYSGNFRDSSGFKGNKGFKGSQGFTSKQHGNFGKAQKGVSKVGQPRDVDKQLCEGVCEYILITFELKRI